MEEKYIESKDYCETYLRLQQRGQNVDLVKILSELIDGNHLISRDTKEIAEKKIVELLSII